MLLAAAVAVAVVVAVVLLLTLGGDDETADSPRPTNPTSPPSSAATTPSTAVPTTPGTSTAPVEVSTPGGGQVSTLVPGASVEVAASGFRAASSATVTLRSDPIVLGTATADATGAVRLVVEVPDGVEPGTHTIEVSGTGADGSPRVVSTRIEIIDAELPNTGPRRRLALAGLVALVAGLAMVLLARPRRRATL